MALALAARVSSSAGENPIPLMEVGLGSSDIELAEALIVQHPNAARIAWQRFAPLVRSMVRRALRSHADVEDLVQDIFSEFFGSVRRLRHPAALKSLVVVVTRRSLSRELRRRRLRAHLRFDVEAHPEPIGTVGDAAAMHALVHFARLLSRLRARERHAFLLRYVAGLDADEVGAAMGVSTPTARRAFLRARARLQLWAGRNAFLSEFVRPERSAAETSYPQLAESVEAAPPDS